MRDPYRIVKHVQLSEKGTLLAEQGNKYLFRVDPAANKQEIKHAVETLFKVGVVRVNTMNYRGKKKRERTVRYGRRSDWKRAVVTLKQGDKIELV